MTEITDKHHITIIRTLKFSSIPYFIGALFVEDADGNQWGILVLPFLVVYFLVAYGIVSLFGLLAEKFAYSVVGKTFNVLFYISSTIFLLLVTWVFVAMIISKVT